MVSPVSNNLLLQKLLTSLIRSWIKLFVICLYCTPDTYLSKVLISAPFHLSIPQSVMESIFFIIVLEIVFFSTYRWGTEADSKRLSCSFNKNPEAEERPAPGVAVSGCGRRKRESQREGGKDVVTKRVIYWPYTQSHKLPRSKEMSKAH